MPKRKLAVAIFLNLFAMPGLGQMYCGKKARGAVVAGITLMILLALTVTVVQIVSAEAEKIVAAGDDIFAVAQMMSDMNAALVEQGGATMRIYFFLLGVSYIVSVADLFWLYYDEPVPHQS